MDPQILVEGARQNNLKNIDIALPLHKIIVITGLSGSGKSSLAFDTVYSEGQRRYFETFSAYTRQFLDRMDRPQVDRIEGIPPAIAIDQTNPVRTSRSTVGTMTELNDHLKLLYSKAAVLHCGTCGKTVTRDDPDTVWENLQTKNLDGRRMMVTFVIRIPGNFEVDEIKDALRQQGYHRLLTESSTEIEVVQDRLRFSNENRARLIEAVEQAFAHGGGKISIYLLDKEKRIDQTLRYSEDLHCPVCDIHYRDPVPNMFSFNSPVGACETCRGFGRTIGIDYDQVVPDKTKSLAQGAIKTFQTKSYAVCQRELMQSASSSGIRTDVPWHELSKEEKNWVLRGEGDWDDGLWYGLERFFSWLETKSYKMHIRVLLSKYRGYHLCPACGGARLKPEALLWKLDGLDIHQLMSMSIADIHDFFSSFRVPEPRDQAVEVVLQEIRSRLRFLVEVGVGYLSLDRQSRTLSGGEVQRINLTTALGTSLVNTLFVLDEPSIGLHSHDIGRLISILRRLRDSGNTLLIVEHDPELIAAADIVIDMGPEAGEKGGEVQFMGSPDELIRRVGNLSADYLSGRKKITLPAVESIPRRQGGITILGATEHNLKNIDVEIPQGRLTCVTGLSGSGKSTLIQEVLYYGLRKIMKKPVEPPGAHRAILGAKEIDEVVLVDQSPIGKTARSNPVSYVGAFDALRKIFAGQPMAKERGYTAGNFSFNSSKGRCPTCGGRGFEHVEMQFLSDVYLRCPDCDGSRYRSEVLEVKVVPQAHGEHATQPLSIAEVLDLTVDQAVELFSQEQKFLQALEPLRMVGLGYLKLGQPLPSLSGGEAQRLKLAGFLGDTSKKGGKKQHKLFLFDEPTTGLHLHDISVLVAAFRSLQQAGHSLVVIEHNLDVIRSSDWVIDLGPEGGDRGGEVLFAGPSEALIEQKGSYTAAALRDYLSRSFQTTVTAAEGQPTYLPDRISIQGAREHNLRDLEVHIPLDSFTVITGVSGSGKSSLAFDILFSEGQRRYLESLNAYARQFVQPASRPDVDRVSGVPPTVAIEQRTSRGGWKSTVATSTEIYHYLRLLFVKLGIQYCPDCQVPILPRNIEQIVDQLLREKRGRTVEVDAPLVLGRKGYYTDLAKWAAAKGYPRLRVDGELYETAAWPRLDRYREHDILLPLGEIELTPENRDLLGDTLETALEMGKKTVHVLDSKTLETEIYSTARACPSCGRSFHELDPRLFSYNSSHGWCPHCLGAGYLEAEGSEERQPCPVCNGARLKQEALSVRFEGRNIEAFNSMSIGEARDFFRSYKPEGRDLEIAGDVVAELDSRLAFLEQVGLSYLSLNRAAPTLSGGEAQRIRLAAHLGSNLRGVCYILDEPTIGLHPRDNRMLMDSLTDLQKKGNSVIVVEHDEETIRRADHLIDLGPGGGVHGGRLVFSGSFDDLVQDRLSATAQFLREPLVHPLFSSRRLASLEDQELLSLRGARAHNLKSIDVHIPLQSLVVITGVSGSGKSTLARDVLYHNVKRILSNKKGRKANSEGSVKQLDCCDRIEGVEQVDRIVEVD
ncbi:MAG TPA: excinuclease ABC subunit A, partial [Sediminispirochaeta sp.]|nr:excinuclease ABC subunit A [Sediminispirochaeta sp.]